MLKPRYQTLSESLGDFNRMLDGMNKTQPLERRFDDDLQEMLRDEQELQRLEAQIDHAHRVAAGPGLQMTVSEANSLAQMHGHAANMYSDAAVKAAEKVRKYIKSQNPAMIAKMQDVTKRLKAKAQEHASLSKRHSEDEAMVAESKAQPSLMKNFRVLAGIEETTMMPRDPGVWATTRFNAGYEAMAQPFTEAKDSSVKPYSADAHEKREKKDVKTIKKAADDLDRAHGEDIESDEDVQQEAKKWAAAAVKRPGRLHRYFGVPEDQKIPMSKIKAAYNKLKDKEDKSKEEVSLMRALALGIRFKGGDVPGGEKKKGLAGDEDTMATEY